MIFLLFDYFKNNFEIFSFRVRANNYVFWLVDQNLISLDRTHVRTVRGCTAN